MQVSFLQGTRYVAALAALTAMATGQSPADQHTINNDQTTGIAQPEMPRYNGPQPEGGVPLVEHAERLTPIVVTPPETNNHPDDATLQAIYKSEPTPPQSHVYYDTVDGVQWALGKRYKASAGPDGFSYIPFMGSDAPQNYPLHMELGSITIGNEAIQFAAEAEATRKGNRITLDRGPVHVWYDMDLDSVEQSFVLDAAGATSDLELRINVETELQRSELSDGLEYSNELGSVTYRHAVVIDGDGNRLDIPIQTQGEQIALTVPAEFLTNAKNPIVVDPVFGSFLIYDANTRTQLHPDVAYDFTNDDFAFVAYSVFSATDHDVRIESRTSGGAFILGSWVDFTSGDWTQPAIANDNGTDTYLVAAQFTNVDDEQEIWGRTVNAATLGMSPAFLIADSSPSYDNYDVDVGGKSQGASLFKVVWERDFTSLGTRGIRSRLVTPTSPHSTTVAPSLSSVEFMAYDPLINFTDPAISKSSGEAANAEWRVVFNAQIVATGIESINSARYADDGTLLSAFAPLFQISNTAYNLLQLDVSDGLSDVPGPINGASTYFITGNFNGSNGAQVWIYGMDNESYFENQSITVREHRAFSGDSKSYSTISTSRDNFIVTYQEWNPGAGMYDVCQTKFDLVNTGRIGVSERRSVIGSHGFLSGFSAMSASRFSGGNYGSRIMGVTHDSWDGALWRTQGHVTFQNFVTVAGYQYCIGNPNSTGDYGHMTVFGDADVATTKTLHAESMPLNQFGYFLSGQGGFGTIAVSQGVQCLIGGPLGRYNQPLEVFFTGTTGDADLIIGPASYRGPNGNEVVSAGETWNFQAWHRENGGVSNFTDACSVMLD